MWVAKGLHILYQASKKNKVNHKGFLQEDKGNNKIELNPKSQRIDLHEIISITKINH